jgi:predicted extracellular nuclease
MTRLNSSTLCFALCASLAATAACRGGGDDGDDDGNNPDASSGDITIQEIQNDAMPVGTAVNVRGVVVTAVDNYGPRKGNFYVGEPEGGAYSGVLVYGASVDVVAQLAVGDVVDISGAAKDEFGLDTDDATVTELGPIESGSMIVTETGTTTPPAPTVIDALAIGRMETAAREAEYEKYEGVLVTVNNISVTSEIRPVSSSEPDPMFVAFRITGVLEVDSSLAEIPYSATTPPAPFVTGGDCLASITGMGDYFFNYKVLPRATSDIMLGGSGCPAAEAPGTCADGIDNDANGFLDCADRGCAAEPTCTTDTTVVMIQTGAATGGVRVNDVVVTGRKIFPDDIQGFWVQDAAQAAANNGVFVFTATATPPMIGEVVDVTGTVTEFDFGNPPMGDRLTQLTNVTVTPVAGSPVTPVPLTGVPVSTLNQIGAAGEPYESVYVQLSNMRVMSHPGNDRLLITNGTDTIVVDDDAYNYAMATYPATTTCFGTISGIMTTNIFDDERRLLPTRVEDMVTTGGTCN